MNRTRKSVRRTINLAAGPIFIAVQLYFYTSSYLIEYIFDPKIGIAVGGSSRKYPRYSGNGSGGLWAQRVYCQASCDPSSVADPDPGSGVFFGPWSRIRDGINLDPGSRMKISYRFPISESLAPGNTFIMC